MGARPLSPHLGIYRFRHTMALSFAHRATGVGLSFGLIVIAWWLVALASGETAYDAALGWLVTWPVKLMLFGLLAAFLYHMANGVRHLLWDAGFLIEKRQALHSAWVLVAIVLVAVAICGYLLFCPVGRLP
jgi:succinate dehydrogenase / fumarate reductase cytochrome b subunit